MLLPKLCTKNQLAIYYNNTIVTQYIGLSISIGLNDCPLVALTSFLGKSFVKINFLKLNILSK